MSSIPPVPQASSRASPLGRKFAERMGIKGLKSLMKKDPVAAQAMADRIIKNTYRALMTRGMRGCFVYCTDRPLAEYLRSRLRGVSTQQPVEHVDTVVAAKAPSSNVIPLRVVTATERAAGKNAAPLIDLRFAAGSFSESQSLEEGAQDWIELPDWIPYQPGFFVAQVVGESMNKRIPNGSWCLFRAAPGGTRNGKIVVVQHRSIDDPETGGSFRKTPRLFALVGALEQHCSVDPVNYRASFN